MILDKIKELMFFWVDDPKLRVLQRSFQYVQANNIPGDYLEFGVYRGKSYIKAYRMANAYLKRYIRFWAFDSFEGLPYDIGPFKKGHFKCDINDFLDNVKAKGIPGDMIRVVPGWFKDLTRDHIMVKDDLKAASVVMLDCDLGVSTLQALKFVTEYLQIGSIIIFDDWNLLCDGMGFNQKFAFNLWIKIHSFNLSEFMRYGWNGVSFIFDG